MDGQRDRVGADAQPVHPLSSGAVPVPTSPLPYLAVPVKGEGPTATDTQWPRWEVFKQDAPGRPHQAVGSVHAADPQHALYTARSVFARRPAAVSLWVVPETRIHSVTREELDTGYTFSAEAGTEQAYRVFGKRSHKRSMTFMDELGTVSAVGPQTAFTAACTAYGNDLLAYWIIAETDFLGSPEDSDTVESWFAPARDKTYKQQSSYGVIGQHASVRNPRRKSGGEHD